MSFYAKLLFQEPFQNVGGSLLKTSVMMIGEFEYEGIFYPTQSHQNPVFANMTYAFFVGFLIVMSIIIVNLLIGLAVDDIKVLIPNFICMRVLGDVC